MPENSYITPRAIRRASTRMQPMRRGCAGAPGPAGTASSTGRPAEWWTAPPRRFTSPSAIASGWRRLRRIGLATLSTSSSQAPIPDRERLAIGPSSIS